MLGFKAKNKASNNTLAPNQSTDVMNIYQRERFELLSAYIDGDVTASEYCPKKYCGTLKSNRFDVNTNRHSDERSAIFLASAPTERRQIEQWLTTDPEVQCLYERVLKLRPLWSTMPVPTVQSPMKRTAPQVSPSLRGKAKMTTWVGTVLATVLLGTLSAILPPDRQFSVLTMTQAAQPITKLGL